MTRIVEAVVNRSAMASRTGTKSGPTTNTFASASLTMNSTSGGARRQLTSTHTALSEGRAVEDLEVLDAVLVEEGDAVLVADAGGGEPGGDTAGPLVQLGPRHRSVAEHERDAVAALGGVRPQDVPQGADRHAGNVVPPVTPADPAPTEFHLTSGVVIFEGVGVALVTLFDDGGELDAAGTAALAASLADEGMRAILVAGSTGEAATLDPAERVELVTAVRAAVTGWRAGARGHGRTIGPAGRATDRRRARSRRRRRARAVAARLGRPGAVLPRRRRGRRRRSGVRVPLPGDVRPGHRRRRSSRGSGSSGWLASRTPPATRHGSSARSSASTARSTSGRRGCCRRPGRSGATGAILAVANVEPALSIKAFGGDVDAQRALAATCERSHGPAAVKRLLAERGCSAVTRV